MENKKKYRGVNWGSILLFILIIGGILWMANKVQMHQQEISYSTFVKEVEAGNVTAADIRQNSAVPTGRVTLSLKDDSSVRSLNVSDVGKVEEFLQENDVKYSLEDVPKESIIMSAVLPSLITLCGIFTDRLLFYDDFKPLNISWYIDEITLKDYEKDRSEKPKDSHLS